MGTGRPEDQPRPQPNEHRYAQAEIHHDINVGIIGAPHQVIQVGQRLQNSVEERRKLGEKRYGVPGLQPFNGRDMLRDAFEEVIDACVYLRAFCKETGREDDIECYEKLLAEAMYLQSRVIQKEGTLVAEVFSRPERDE